MGEIQLSLGKQLGAEEDCQNKEPPEQAKATAIE